MFESGRVSKWNAMPLYTGIDPQLQSLSKQFLLALCGVVCPVKSHFIVMQQFLEKLSPSWPVRAVGNVNGVTPNPSRKALAPKDFNFGELFMNTNSYMDFPMQLHRKTLLSRHRPRGLKYNRFLYVGYSLIYVAKRSCLFRLTAKSMRIIGILKGKQTSKMTVIVIATHKRLKVWSRFQCYVICFFKVTVERSVLRLSASRL